MKNKQLYFMVQPKVVAGGALKKFPKLIGKYLILILLIYLFIVYFLLTTVVHNTIGISKGNKFTI